VEAVDEERNKEGGNDAATTACLLSLLLVDAGDVKEFFRLVGFVAAGGVL